jgi:hypothetical protein
VLHVHTGATATPASKWHLMKKMLAHASCSSAHVQGTGARTLTPPSRTNGCQRDAKASPIEWACSCRCTKPWSIESNETLKTYACEAWRWREDEKVRLQKTDRRSRRDGDTHDYEAGILGGVRGGSRRNTSSLLYDQGLCPGQERKS